MAEVGNKETAGVGGVALKLDAVASWTGGAEDSGAVDADIDLVVDYLVEAGGGSL